MVEIFKKDKLSRKDIIKDKIYLIWDNPTNIWIIGKVYSKVYSSGGSDAFIVEMLNTTHDRILAEYRYINMSDKVGDEVYELPEWML